MEKLLLQTEMLTAKLSNFGLNPDDWKVTLLSEDQIEVRNRTDQDFYFQGKVKEEANRLDICQLSLIEI